MMITGAKTTETIDAPAKTAEPVRQPGTKPKKPSMWHVIILNDDWTPQDFVVAVLMRFFNKNPEEATTLMLEVHNTGKGVAGTFTHEVAEMKIEQVVVSARMKGHPLMAVLEKA